MANTKPVTNESGYRRAKVINIFQYAFGGVGSNIAYMLTMSYLTFFYTDIFGINPLVIAGIMLTARLIDAFTDPLMGMLSDRTRSKMGRYRAYLIFGAPILGFLVFLMFCSPNLSPTMKIVYAYVTYIIYSLASTVVNIPYHSLTPVMTNDPNQRTVVAVSKQTGGMAAGIFVQVLALPLVKIFGGGSTGWMAYGALSGIMVTLCFWMCAKGAKNADLPNLTSVKGLSVPMREQLKLIYRNRPLLMLLFAAGTDQVALAAANGVNMFYFTYFLGRQDLIPIISLVSLPISLIGMFFVPPLAKKFGKKTLYLVFTTLSLIPLSIMYMLPASQANLIFILLLLNTVLVIFPGTLGWSMLPDCVEYGEWKHGIRGDGTVSSTLTFINKCGMAIGGALTGVLLASSGYIAGQAQTTEALEAIRLMRFIFPIIGYGCSLLSMSFYNITNKFYNQMTTDLSQRKQNNLDSAKD